MNEVSIVIRPVIGGFVVEYPVHTRGVVERRTEVATSLGKAMRVAKTAVEEFSLVKKSADDAE